MYAQFAVIFHFLDCRVFSAQMLCPSVACRCCIVDANVFLVLVTFISL